MGAGDYETVRDTVAGDVDDLSATQVLLSLVLLRQLRDELSDWEPRLIEAARQLGISWADLAPALGVASRQAAEKRYLRVRQSAAEGTGDQRVQAERDKRAGDRVVRDWARRNSAMLRRLAALVGEFDDDVRDALGHDDAATLLGPLAGAHRQMERSHPGLAAEIAGVTEQATILRRTTQQERINRSAADQSTFGRGEPEL